MKFRWWYLAVGLAVLALLVVGTVPRLLRKRSVEQQKPATPEAQVVHPRRVQSEELALPGNLQAIEETVINARAVGYLRQRYVDIGSKVRRGQMLAQIDSPDLDRQVEQAQADYRKAQAGARQSQAEVSRLHAGVANAQAGQARAVAKLRQSEANLAQVRSQLVRTQRAVGTQRAQVRAATTRLELAEKTYRRWAALLLQKAVPPQEVDERRAARDEAASNVSANLATLQESQANVESARAQLQANEADVNAARADVNAAQQQVTAAVAELQAGVETAGGAQSAVQSSLSNVAHYRALQAYERVEAPFDGVITTREVDAGALVGSAGGNTTGLFRLGRTDALRIQVRVPQVYVSQVSDGMPATVTLRELPNQTFRGQVFRRSGGLDEASRTLLSEVRLDNRQGKLLPGMYATVHFPIKGLSPWRVPSSCLMINAQGNQLGLVGADNVVHYKVVNVGRDLGAETEILSGVGPNDLVLTAPSYTLADGVKVKPVQPKPKEAAKK